MKNPPYMIKMTVEAVGVLKGIKPDRSLDIATGKKSDDFWKPALRMLADAKFLEGLVQYDKVRLGQVNKD